MSTKAMKLALEALKTAEDFDIDADDGYYSKAIKALEEALAQSRSDVKQSVSVEQGEPVAWMFQHEETGRITFVEAQQLEWGFEKGNPRLKKIGPLYTPPQPAERKCKPLTDEQIKEMWSQYNPLHGIASFARAIEAAHGIKE